MMRRRRREEEWAEEDAVAYEPEQPMTVEEPAEPATFNHEQPAIVAPSAFAWANPKNANGDNARNASPSATEGEERNDGETWVERAYRGPSSSNPSVSLKTRLRRAAFFDKRERDAAAGLAEPIDPSAGLPRAVTREEERELA